MSFEMNKIAGALLGTLVFVMGLGFIADLIFHEEAPEQPGFVVAVTEAPSHGDTANAAAPAEEPIAVRLAGADPEKGKALARACTSCHALDPSNANKVGPGLWNIVGRKPGTHEGFRYSTAMVDYGADHVWDYDRLDAFILNPKQEVPGTKMTYAGLKKAEDRAHLIAYLRSLADSPAPLPEATPPQ